MSLLTFAEADGSVNSVSRSCGPGGCHRRVALGSAGYQPAWADDAALRQRLLDQLAGMLDQSGGDLARLVARETGKPFAAAQIEVAQAAAALRDGAGACGITPGEAAVQTVVGDAGDPLVSVVGGIARAIAAGGAVVVLQSRQRTFRPRSPWPNCRLAQDFRPAPYACFTAICKSGWR